MQSLTANSERELASATAARHDFLKQLFARYIAASGKQIDDSDNPTRMAALETELHLRRYGEREARIAQEWILRGNPARYGSLTLADFYPTSEQLASVGVSVADEIAKAERLAEGRGYDNGWHSHERYIAAEEKAIAPKKILEEDERIELVYLRGLTEALRDEFDKWKKDANKVARVKEIKRKISEQFNYGE